MTVEVDYAAIGRWQPHAKRVGRPVVRRLWDVELNGIENLPTSGPAIIAPNHISFIDSAFLMFLVPRPLTFVGKAEYLDDWKTRRLFPAMGMIPIDRTGGSSSSRALDAACRVLEGGQLFAIYPEGTRSRSGHLHKGHTGVARIAERTGAPIIPTGIVGTREIQYPDKPLPRVFQPAKISFGEPIHADDVGGSGRLRHRQITDSLMYEISRLSGQTYVDEYATKKAQAVPTDTAVFTSEPIRVPETVG